ncbi:sensor histidine kinase [Maribacter sp. 2307ULW6-5]|uniref:sensor histidine kinase n=1 Tax=Maribacter sp. 2307ULW6-5 TaxID=3386275 RepID=UPI0039BD6BC4
MAIEGTRPFLERQNKDGYQILFWHHILFWVLYFTFNTVRWGSYFHDYPYAFKTNLLSFLIHIPFCYLNIYGLMPRLLFKRKFVAYGLVILGCLVTALLVRFNLTYYLVGTNVWPEGPEPIDSITFNYAVNMMLGELYVLSFVTAIKLTVDWLRGQVRLNDLEKKQMHSEIKFLRSQISPHFFFNTLNNIYSLTLEKSDKAPGLLLKLSALMRYLLYSTNQPLQLLEKEVESIKNYVAIERVRFDDSLKLTMSVNGSLEGAKIAPMLLIPIVENAFKHGARNTVEHAFIQINLVVMDDFLYFEVHNSVPQEINATQNGKGGIGLANIKKRLSLGYDRSHYDLALKEGKNTYTANLKIKVK